MRKESELWSIVLDNIGRLTAGLCLLIADLEDSGLITYSEWCFLDGEICDHVDAVGWVRYLDAKGIKDNRIIFLELLIEVARFEELEASADAQYLQPFGQL